MRDNLKISNEEIIEVAHKLGYSLSDFYDDDFKTTRDFIRQGWEDKERDREKSKVDRYLDISDAIIKEKWELLYGKKETQQKEETQQKQRSVPRWLKKLLMYFTN